jgi:hypothetical protein
LKHFRLPFSIREKGLGDEGLPPRPSRSDSATFEISYFFRRIVLL